VFKFFLVVVAPVKRAAAIVAVGAGFSQRSAVAGALL